MPISSHYRQTTPQRREPSDPSLVFPSASSELEALLTGLVKKWNNQPPRPTIRECAENAQTADMLARMLDEHGHWEQAIEHYRRVEMFDLASNVKRRKAAFADERELSRQPGPVGRQLVSRQGTSFTVQIPRGDSIKQEVKWCVEAPRPLQRLFDRLRHRSGPVDSIKFKEQGAYVFETGSGDFTAREFTSKKYGGIHGRDLTALVNQTFWVRNSGGIRSKVTNIYYIHTHPDRHHALRTLGLNYAYGYLSYGDVQVAQSLAAGLRTLSGLKDAK